MAAVNGQAASSEFISHLTSYPVISDSISGFKANPIGQRSLSIADHGYSTLAKPVLPYLKGPYSYVSPYVNKADSLANGGLSKVDDRFPIVKEPTEKITGTLLSYAIFPLKVANDGKEHVLQIFGKEYQNLGQAGVIPAAKAAVNTGVIITAASAEWFFDFLRFKKQQVQQVVNEKTPN
ncbi:MAG: hypothetical protein M1829_004457 [Trizodia sp. TS-e1964]|nr:MAG: hypothetical protein M1829_004457 [Trizodia sp. TS-e1964]